MADCPPHFFLIDAANGTPTSPGICKYCGEIKEFKNSLGAPSSRDWNTTAAAKRNRQDSDQCLHSYLP